MAECALVINVGKVEQSQALGALGTYTVPPPPPGEEFGLLVIYPAGEIHDIGNQGTKTMLVEALEIAKSIAGTGSKDSMMQRWGLLTCKAVPDLPKSLETALKAEAVYLNKHKPMVRYRRDESGTLVADNVYEEGEREKRDLLSRTVVEERDAFHQQCRKLVDKSEVAAAKANLYGEYARLVAQGDLFWQRPTDQRNISDLHRQACIAMGQERPWCYVPMSLEPCPGCQAQISPKTIKCPKCGAMIEFEFKEYDKMSRDDRAKLLYPGEAVESAPPNDSKRK